jgi:hypothetical protein
VWPEARRKAARYELQKLKNKCHDYAASVVGNRIDMLISPL